MSRNPKRIDVTLAKLREYWLQRSDQRFGQMLVNLFGAHGKDPWFAEEEQWNELLDREIEATREWQRTRRGGKK